MKKSLWAALLLTACGAPTPPPAAPVASVPPELRNCPAGVAQAPAPPMPRTPESIIAAYNKAKTAGDATLEALKICAAKVDRLNQIIESR